MTVTVTELPDDGPHYEERLSTMWNMAIMYALSRESRMGDSPGLEQARQGIHAMWKTWREEMARLPEGKPEEIEREARRRYPLAYRWASEVQL